MTRQRLLPFVLIGISVLTVVSLALVLLPGLRHPVRLLSPGEFEPPPPPDLRKCTHLEVYYRIHSYEASWPNDLFSPEERDYLRSLETIVVDDANAVEALAHEVMLAEYLGIRPKPFRAAEFERVTGYCGSKKTTSFVIWGRDMRTEDGYAFRNPHRRFASILQKLRPEVEPFRRRKYCALRLQSLWRHLRVVTGTGDAHTTPTQWCDAVKQRIQKLMPMRPDEDRITWAFSCPSMREPHKSHYAMNPQCRPDSLPEMVLLFETKAGWNQHGGPELFTLDNHESKGGCVLFNDGTVKFVRTEEELKQLRWR